MDVDNIHDIYFKSEFEMYRKMAVGKIIFDKAHGARPGCQLMSEPFFLQK
jgi:hypothetical protein